MSTHVESTRLTATGDVKAQGAIGVLRYIQVTTITATSTVTFKSGGSGGTTRLVIDAPVGTTVVEVPSDGIRFDDGIHATFGANVQSMTAMYT